MVRGARALPGAQLTSCLPMGAHGCGLVLRTAEPQRSLLGSLGKPGERQEEEEGWGSFSHPKTCVLDQGPSWSPITGAQVARAPALVFPLSLCLCLSHW